MMNLTEEQKKAVYLEGSNIIVSAGAGSGKTAVLSKRVLRKVMDGIDIRKILVLTFTNEAALEMKSRIRELLEEQKRDKDLEYIDTAYITTFDAYALAVVRKYHYLLNVSKNIAIIDASIMEIKKKEFLEIIFNDLYESKDPDFLKLINDFTAKDDTEIKEYILKIKKGLDLKYDKKEYLDSYIANFYSDSYIDKLLQEYFAYIKDKCEELENDLSALEGLLDEKLYTKVYDVYSKLTKPKSYDALVRVKDLEKVQFRNIPEEALEIKDNLKRIAEEIQSLTLYSMEELKKQYKSTEVYGRAIIKIINRLDSLLKEYKFKNEAFEFLDIANMAIEIVKDHEDIREELKNYYNEILIDEYQDTNDLQEIFISYIENNNVYMVGDIKQSIYRFRNANPNIFKEKYDNYAKNINGQKIDLLKNFRSREEVLNNINEIFDLIMTEEVGSVNYQNNHEMVYGNLDYINLGNNTYDNNLEILKYDNYEKKYTDLEIEAFSIAKDIKEKIKEKYQVYDFKLKKNRDVKYSDFCIILDRNTKMATYKKIFEYLNIPMEVYKDDNLTMANDILIIKSIIGLILKIKNKEYDTLMRYYFVSIARSFVGNLEDALIFNYVNTNTYFESLIYQKCFKIALEIDNMTPGMLYDVIIKDFQFYENLIRVGDITNALMRLDALRDLILNMEDLGFTIKDFKDYLEDILNNKFEIRYKEAKSALNCVKIMNIHKSKGLQFPICYYAGYKDGFNIKDLNDRFMFSKKYGIITPFYQEGIGTLFTKELVKALFLKEEISEKIRLLYVALTRAQEKMIMVVPTFKKESFQKGAISKEVGYKYRSFHDIMGSIIINLGKYVKNIDLKSLNITRDYEYTRLENKLVDKNSTKIEFRENKIDFKVIEQKHASKIIKRVLTKKEEETLEYGTKMHEMLELADLKGDNNKHIKNLRELFDLEKANIYKELEFILQEEDTEYHGIIDLLLEYEDEFKIIDYKLKNIEDEEYIKQLNVYYKYIRSISDKKISLYLYSILDNKIKEVEVLQSV